ncbi:flagellar biosynthesis protein FliQ [Enterocloster bolteae]|uniref:flagellar biosynthesis protein FliQ n=1 Tax=Enterocloster bolteae TaxID=208479 RepID=UPI001D07C448|nr:flagellar biosynthesis protein FliQ [Enterocloster bolteae]MCB6927701.1 flagellar biosynthesis protein FliQ [Enterocloster bolteae]MCQ4757548.1 flagellar biosynthesis protein FliQ [Enterocloster bolteae]
MSAEQVMEIMKEAMLVAFEIAGPLLIISIAVGLLVAIFQAATQIHEQTLTFVPKLIVIALVLLALGSWMSKVMNEFVAELFAIMAAL